LNICSVSKNPFFNWARIVYSAPFSALSHFVRFVDVLFDETADQTRVSRARHHAASRGGKTLAPWRRTAAFLAVALLPRQHRLTLISGRETRRTYFYCEQVAQVINSAPITSSRGVSKSSAWQNRSFRHAVLKVFLTTAKRIGRSPISSKEVYRSNAEDSFRGGIGFLAAYHAHGRPKRLQVDAYGKSAKDGWGTIWKNGTACSLRVGFWGLVHLLRSGQWRLTLSRTSHRRSARQLGTGGKVRTWATE